MEKYFLLLGVSIAVFQGVFGQDSPVIVKFADTDPKHVSLGAENIQFTCEVNQNNLMVVVNNAVQIVRHVGDQETILSEGGRLTEGKPEFYSVDIKGPINGEKILVLFQISKVRDIDDGTLECRFVPGSSDVAVESGSSKVEVVVIRPLDSLKLQFGSNNPIMETMNEPVSMDTGPHTVKCMAEGSNPGTEDVHLYLHGNKLPHNQPVIEAMATDVRKFRTTINATVDISYENTGQELECRAQSKANDMHSVKMTIKVNVYEPDVMCNETKAYVGQMYPVLSCIVKHKGLNIADYAYQLGKTGETILSGEQNEDYVEVKEEDIGDGVTRVDLHLYKAHDWHFDTDFYLLVTHMDGHVSRATVQLQKTEEKDADNDDSTEGDNDAVTDNGGRGRSSGPKDSSSALGASIVTLLVSLICALMKSI